MKKILASEVKMPLKNRLSKVLTGSLNLLDF